MGPPGSALARRCRRRAYGTRQGTWAIAVPAGDAGLASCEGFEERYDGLFVRAFRTADSLLEDRSLAEEIAAETLARAYVYWPKVAEYASAWVTRVASNLAVDNLRGKPARRAPRQPPQDHTLDQVAFQAYLVGLPRRQRQVLALRYLLDFDAARTAQVLGVSTETVHTHAKRALRRLRGRLTTHLDDEGVSHDIS